MKSKCKKCGYEGEFHQVGRKDIPIVIIQCPKCCFIDRLVELREIESGCYLDEAVEQ